MNKSSLSLLGEHGIDHGMESGRFNKLGADFGPGFNEYWWNEMCRFEKRMACQFPEFAKDFIPGDTPYYKSFTIWPQESLPLHALIGSIQDYLKIEQPDASAVIASPLGLKLASGRIVVTGAGIWIEQDLAFWLSEKIQPSSAPNVIHLRRDHNAKDIRSALPWLNDVGAIRLGSGQFWSRVYSNSGFVPVAEGGVPELQIFEMGHEIIRHLSDRYSTMTETGRWDIYISSSLGSHRVIKLECPRSGCDREFVEGVSRVVSGIDETWAVRIMVFEDLLEDDSYCGSLIVKPGNRYVLEAGA
jgi:hypothetical protein